VENPEPLSLIGERRLGAASRAQSGTPAGKKRMREEQKERQHSKAEEVPRASIADWGSRSGGSGPPAGPNGGENPAGEKTNSRRAAGVAARRPQASTDSA